MKISLDGKPALVTGAASGIGRAIAIALAQAGATLIVNHFRRAAEAEQVAAEILASGGRAIVAEADVTDAIQVQRKHAAASTFWETTPVLFLKSLFWTLPKRNGITS